VRWSPHVREARPDGRLVARHVPAPLGEVSLSLLLRQQLDLQRELSARAARELVLVTKQLVYFECYARELAPRCNMARDLFLEQPT
jgi:predicted unusual protein kinase regulating ubiquinone biosynthesis (AarF/ABC1/UbiB family)